MPLFSVVCQDCQAENELLQRGSEQAVCPSCGSAKVERLLSKFAPLSSAASAPPMGCGASQCCGMRGGCGN